MTFWQRWVRQPRSVFLRKACFQVHLWLGLALGLYVVVLCLSGSALVFRREMNRAFVPVRPAIDETIQRVFNAYTGEDLGDPFPRKLRAVLWVATLHDDLLLPRRGLGRFWNGVGSILVTLLCVGGAVVWWPGITGWRRGVYIKRRSAWPRFNFDLHSALGFWFFVFIAMWGVSGIYLSLPTPFMNVVDWVFGPPENYERPVDVALNWLARLHFGRWRSHTLKVVWVVAGLVPPAMFVTGVVMWWNRVVRKPRTARVSQPAVNLQQEPQRVE